MPLAAGEVQQWAERELAGDGWGDIAKRSGVKRTTLHQQLIRGRVAEKSVVMIARAYQLSVIDTLATFSPYRDLVQELRPPRETELLSQVIYSDVLKEILRRRGEAFSAAEQTLEPFPFPDSVRAWVDAIDPGTIRRDVADQLGITPSSLSSQLRRTLNPENAVVLARHGGVAPSNGLVIIGLIREEEGLWPAVGRLKTLRSASDDDLIGLAIGKLTVLKRNSGGDPGEAEQLEQILESLG